MEFIAVGSVVRLKGKKQTIDVVIIGRMLQNNKSDICEYVGVIYPYGYTGGEDGIVFKHEDIEEVIHEGYVDEREEEYNKELVRVKEMKGK